MELLDRYLLRVALVFALAMYALVSVGITIVASPSKASITAAVQHTPVIVGLRLELRRGCLTLAVLAQLRQEQYGSTLRQDSGLRGSSIDERAPCSLLQGLKGITSQQHGD